MTELILIRQYIPGRTCPYFRDRGYEIVESVEVESSTEIPVGSLQRLLDSIKQGIATEATIARHKSKAPSKAES